MDWQNFGIQPVANDQQLSTTLHGQHMTWWEYPTGELFMHHETSVDRAIAIAYQPRDDDMQVPLETTMDMDDGSNYLGGFYSQSGELSLHEREPLYVGGPQIDVYHQRVYNASPQLQMESTHSREYNGTKEIYSSDDKAIFSIDSDSSFMFVENPTNQHDVWAVSSKNDIGNCEATSVLHSSKATDNSDVRVSSQTLSELDRNEPFEVELHQGQPLLAREESLLDWWFAGTQFDDKPILSSDYPDYLSLPASSSHTKGSKTSTVVRSFCKAESVRSFVSRLTSEPRQGKKRPIPIDDSSSSNSSSERSKRTSSSKTSILCPAGCSKTFTRKSSLKRHLQAACKITPLGQQCWVCRPLSRRNGESECLVCHQAATNVTCTHRMAECWARTEGGFFSFYRRDSMKRHLKDYHSVREEDVNQLVDQMEMTIDEFLQLVESARQEIDDA